MQVTFLIGNGFDVNLGLKTKYTDFYDTYIESNKDLENDNVVKKFSDKIKKDYETWSDFEVAFAENIEGTKDDVIKILYNFNCEFIKYLSGQMQLCDYSDSNIADMFKDFLTKGYNFLENKYKQKINLEYRNRRDHIVINFINFNYTDTLEKLIEILKIKYSGGVLATHGTDARGSIISEKIGSILYIHGKTGENIIVGIDSIEQIKDEYLRNDDKVEPLCVKYAINEYIGNKVVEDQFVNMINSSNIIYAYGLSFGASDKRRWEKIVNWLNNSDRHQLIIYKYNADFKSYNKAYLPQKLAVIDDCRNQYLKLLGISEDNYEKYEDQVFVIDSSDVLNFRLVNDNQDSLNEEKEFANV